MTFVFTACTSNPNASDMEAAAALQQKAAYNTDTVGLSQFHNWKAQNELADVEDYNKPEQYAAAPVQRAKQPSKAPVRKAPVTRAPVETSSSTSSPAPSSTDDNVSGGNEGVASSESEGEAKAPVKKGISKAAKGAVIGGVVGAVGGAIINKDNRVVGAVIGGVIGAGGGYGIGRGMDKKDGRILIN